LVKVFGNRNFIKLFSGIRIFFLQHWERPSYLLSEALGSFDISKYDVTI